MLRKAKQGIKLNVDITTSYDGHERFEMLRISVLQVIKLVKLPTVINR